jgi:hypothetical protein
MRTLVIPPTMNARRNPTYGLYPRILLIVKLTYMPTPAYVSWAKFGTLAVRYVSVNPMLRSVNFNAKTKAAVHMASNITTTSTIID